MSAFVKDKKMMKSRYGHLNQKMMNKKIVSIVIPAYNAEEFIRDAITSVFNQTYRPIEIIVVNDGSTDSTLELVSNLFNSIREDNKSELKIIDVGENRGAANALNVGFSSAMGDYICWLSADDIFIDQKKVQKQVECMNRTNAFWSYFKDFYMGTCPSESKLVKTNYLPYDSRFRILDPLFINDASLRLMLLLFINPINGSSVMIKKDCFEKFGQFDPVLGNVDADGDLWMRYSALGLKLAAIKGAPIFYRVHSQQTSKKTQPMSYGAEITRMRMLLAIEKKGELTKLIKRFYPFFPIIFKSKWHLQRPFVSEFLCNYILNNRKDFNVIFVKYIERVSESVLKEVEKHIRFLKIDRGKFLSDLHKFSESDTFKKFEHLYIQNYYSYSCKLP